MLKKYTYWVGSVFFFVIAGLILAVGYFPAVDCGRDRSVSGFYSLGNLAVIDQPANIFISSHYGFVVEQHNQNGDVITHEAYKKNDTYEIRLVTDQPTSLLMVKQSSLFISPYLIVSLHEDSQNPGLIIQRSPFKPLEQLFKWYGFPFFLLPVLISIMFLYHCLFDRE